MANIPGPGGDGGSATPADPSAVTYTFIVGWILFILLLVLIAKTRIGYVIIYYSLLLMILVILLSEYQVIAPLLNPMTIGELQTATTPTPTQ